MALKRSLYPYLRAKTIGVMPMIDQGEKDDKIIVILADVDHSLHLIAIMTPPIENPNKPADSHHHHHHHSHAPLNERILSSMRRRFFWSSVIWIKLPNLSSYIVVCAEQVCDDTENNFGLINQKGIDPPSLDLLARAGIVALRRAKQRNMECLVLYSWDRHLL